MKKSKSISNYFFKSISNFGSIKRNIESLNGIQVIEKILSSFNPRSYYVVIIIQKSKNHDPMAIDQLMGSLQVP